MDYTPKLSDKDVMEYAREVLAEHVPLEADGYVCTGADLWQILLGVSVHQGTIHAVCDSLADAPSDTTVRGYLNEQLTVESYKQLAEIESLGGTAFARSPAECASVCAFGASDAPCASPWSCAASAVSTAVPACQICAPR